MNKPEHTQDGMTTLGTLGNAETCTDHADPVDQPCGKLKLVKMMQICRSDLCDLCSDLIYPTCERKDWIPGRFVGKEGRKGLRLFLPYSTQIVLDRLSICLLQTHVIPSVVLGRRSRTTHHALRTQCCQSPQR